VRSNGASPGQATIPLRSGAEMSIQGIEYEFKNQEDEEYREFKE
jgi:hypothetical protein